MQKETKQTPWQGSMLTYALVYNQIKQRWGEEMARRYDPKRNARTMRSWNEMGFRVKRGERALQSVTYVPIENEAGDVIDVVHHRVNLFFFPQLERVIK